MSRGNNGGIGGSGVFGLVGTTVQCKADDDSAYCNFAKLINVIIWIAVLYFLFTLARDHMKKK